MRCLIVISTSVLIHMSSMDLCYHLCFSDQLAVLLSKYFFQPNSLIPAIFIGTISFCHSAPHSVAMALAEGHMLSRKQKLLASTFSLTSQLISMKFDVLSSSIS